MCLYRTSVFLPSLRTPVQVDVIYFSTKKSHCLLIYVTFKVNIRGQAYNYIYSYNVLGLN